jgi:hypothetical protein
MKKSLSKDDDAGFAVIKKLIDLASVNHPAVRIPSTKTLDALLRQNPPNEFLRRLKAFRN